VGTIDLVALKVGTIDPIDPDSEHPASGASRERRRGEPDGRRAPGQSGRGGFGLGGNIIVSSITEAHARFTQAAISASLAHAVGAGWSGFWELYGASAQSLDGQRAWLADTGMSHPVGHNLQVDVSVGRGLTADAPDWFIGVGFAVRGRFNAASGSAAAR
jgi:hypothetical protein